MTSKDRGPAAADAQEGARSSSSGDRSRAGHRRSRRRERRQLPLWQETIILFATALVLAVVIKALFVQAFYIPSESMEPGLVKNDRILVEKPSYWGDNTPERGDVVVFKDPGGWLGPTAAEGPDNALAHLLVKIGLYPEGGHLVKRVIGIPGDTISCCDQQGRLSVNGTPLNEKAYVKGVGQIPCNGPMPSGADKCDWTSGPVPEGDLFVMGDNRSRSADSTVHLCGKEQTECTDGSQYVAEDLVVGKVFVLLWPWDRFDWLSRPDSFADVPDGR